MLANISLGHEVRLYILEAMQMFSEAWRTLSAATIENCFPKAENVPYGAKEYECN
jgi:hypothetical protein